MKVSRRGFGLATLLPWARQEITPPDKVAQLVTQLRLSSTALADAVNTTVIRSADATKMVTGDFFRNSK